MILSKFALATTLGLFGATSAWADCDPPHGSYSGGGAGQILVVVGPQPSNAGTAVAYVAELDSLTWPTRTSAGSYFYNSKSSWNFQAPGSIVQPKIGSVRGTIPPIGSPKHVWDRSTCRGQVTMQTTFSEITAYNCDGSPVNCVASPTITDTHLIEGRTFSYVVSHDGRVITMIDVAPSSAGPGYLIRLEHD
jgi:hypothetical protein